ncbi:hypothetical protein CERZMDRAFT_90419 [Cercospora zeae-maydis SCOH1-5]|uniref:Uncharacterized protein n=1 Tax=Cercospora zeae-maydis SCOH1-5 TaxID=717836 RepID=A0A6A6FKY1_9PEZI|nr:hypothetical protein CERZMDRAFT_90419 [Cercospora zeae-maydis SCOH1-5]
MTIPSTTSESRPRNSGTDANAHRTPLRHDLSQIHNCQPLLCRGQDSSATFSAHWLMPFATNDTTGSRAECHTNRDLIKAEIFGSPQLQHSAGHMQDMLLLLPLLRTCYKNIDSACMHACMMTCVYVGVSSAL